LTQVWDIKQYLKGGEMISENQIQDKTSTSKVYVSETDDSIRLTSNDRVIGTFEQTRPGVAVLDCGIESLFNQGWKVDEIDILYRDMRGVAEALALQGCSVECIPFCIDFQFLRSEYNRLYYVKYLEKYEEENQKVRDTDQHGESEPEGGSDEEQEAPTA
jgi:hypothetical protein